MSELSFLLELLLKHKLGKPTKDAIVCRIMEIEARIPGIPYQPLHIQRPDRTAQSPSTQRILDEMAQEQAPAMVEHVAQTPAAAQALAQRNEAIRIAVSGREEKGRSSPRKF